MDQLRQIADAEGCSMNAIVASYIDRCFEIDGNMRIDTLAPEFREYLARGSQGDRH